MGSPRSECGGKLVHKQSSRCQCGDCILPAALNLVLASIIVSLGGFGLYFGVVTVTLLTTTKRRRNRTLCKPPPEGLSFVDFGL